MSKDKVKDAATEARREYYRRWRANNRERVKKYNQEYWSRKAKANGGGKDGEKHDEKL